MKKNQFIQFLAVILVGTSGSTLPAALTPFLFDEGAFANAVATGDMTLEGFDGFTADSSRFDDNGSLAVGDLTFSSTYEHGQVDYNYVEVDDDHPYSKSLNTTQYIPFALREQDKLTITFASPVNAFGAYFKNFGNGETVEWKVNNADNDIVSPGTLDFLYVNVFGIGDDMTDVAIFAGIVSDTPFTKLEISGSSGSVDQLQYGVVEVPEPSIYGLVFATLGIFLALRHQRTSAKRWLPGGDWGRTSVRRWLPVK